jgi:hypothetical protein
LNFRVHAELVLLQAEDFVVKENSVGGIFFVDQLLDTVLRGGVFSPQGGYFLFDGFSLS